MQDAAVERLAQEVAGAGSRGDRVEEAQPSKSTLRDEEAMDLLRTSDRRLELIAAEVR